MWADLPAKSASALARRRAMSASIRDDSCAVLWARSPSTFSAKARAMASIWVAGDAPSARVSRSPRFWAMRTTSRPMASMPSADFSSEALTCSPTEDSARSMRSIRSSAFVSSSRRIISTRLLSTWRARVSASFSKRSASRAPSGSIRASAACRRLSRSANERSRFRKASVVRPWAWSSRWPTWASASALSIPAGARAAAFSTASIRVRSSFTPPRCRSSISYKRPARAPMEVSILPKLSSVRGPCSCSNLRRRFWPSRISSASSSARRAWALPALSWASSRRSRPATA